MCPVSVNNVGLSYDHPEFLDTLDTEVCELCYVEILHNLLTVSIKTVSNCFSKLLQHKIPQT